MRILELKPIKESTEDYEAIESIIKKAFREYLYSPLLKELSLSKDTIENAVWDPLLSAIQTGKVTYSGNTFRGEFSQTVSKKIRSLGGKWNSKSHSFSLDRDKLPPELDAAFLLANSRFTEKIKRISKTLDEKSAEKFAEFIQTAKLFASTLTKIDRQLKSSKKDVALVPDLSPAKTKRIADEWQNNLDLWVTDFAEKEIKSLRKSVLEATLKGNRRDFLEKKIQKSYGVTADKAKFLARQETALLMTKFKEVRYTEANILEYRWGCVAGSKNHPVRPMHKKLEGKIFRWDAPPITSENGARNNPGQDYNCRCFARPIVRFKETS